MITNFNASGKIQGWRQVSACFLHRKSCPVVLSLIPERNHQFLALDSVRGEAEKDYLQITMIRWDFLEKMIRKSPEDLKPEVPMTQVCQSNLENPKEFP